MSTWLAIAELATVKNTDFDHGYHLLSWESKRPVSEETGQ
jgi:hypothetical protein